MSCAIVFFLNGISQSIGAVNCLIRNSSDGKLFACNTDYVGAITAIEDALRGFFCILLARECSFIKFLQILNSTIVFIGSHHVMGTTGSPLAGKLFVVIGAGGAGKALAYGAKEKGARVVIANRTYG